MFINDNSPVNIISENELKSDALPRQDIVYLCLYQISLRINSTNGTL